MSDLFKCGYCEKEVNPAKQASTKCTKCKKDFCSAFHRPCFSNHCMFHECDGSSLTTLSPEWKVNLVSKKEN